MVQAPSVTQQTATTYGYLWHQHPRRGRYHGAEQHFIRLAEAVGLSSIHGLVLDAGCGNGGDLTHLAAHPGVSVVGLELSQEGCAASASVGRAYGNITVIQGDMARMPLVDEVFDLAYSYGVLHHLTEAQEGLRELVRVTKPGGRVAFYVYEEVAERSRWWGGLLRLVNRLRWVTVRLPGRLLYSLCVLAAPVVFLIFTIPFRLLRRMASTRPFAQGIPFQHAGGPFSLAADLYDRFAAPIEHRFTQQQVVSLCRQAGLCDLTVHRARGWMVSACKPSDSLTR